MNEIPTAVDFALKEEPLSRADAFARREEFEDSDELPRSHGQPFLGAIARDPETIFAYWDVDWAVAFRDEAPLEQKVYLRLNSEQSGEVEWFTVEPMSGSAFIASVKPDTEYRVELGYFAAATTWQSMALANLVTTPAAGVTSNLDFNLVTVPFHLHFQRMVEMFRGSKYDGAALAGMLSQLQSEADGFALSGSNSEGEEAGTLASELTWTFTSDDIAGRREFRSVKSEILTKPPLLRRILAGRTSSPTAGFPGQGLGS